MSVEDFMDTTCEECGCYNVGKTMCYDCGISKDKVKEAIEKKILAHDNGDCNYDALEELLKELGLE